jgi:hypothetical protein
VNGIIAMLLPGSDGVGRKAFDLKVTNSFALIALGPGSYLFRPPSTLTPLAEYQHLTIPPDLHVHATASGNTTARLTVSRSIVRKDGSVSRGCHHIVTYVTAPADACRPLIGRWNGAALLSPHPDAAYTPTRTRLVVDFFVHQQPQQVSHVQRRACAVPGTRLAADNHGSSFGPYMFREVSRNGRVEPQFWFTLRMGYLDSAIAPGSPLVVPALAL